MKVKLITHTPDPDKVVTMAAKLCYSKVGIDEIEENLTDEQIDKFLNHLVSIGHESPLEHTTFTFGIEGISRSCSHQIVRHRIASFSQQSQRYVKLDQFEYIIPPQIANIPYLEAEYISFMNECQYTYDYLVDNLMKEKIRTNYGNFFETRAYQTEEGEDYIDAFQRLYPKEYNKIEKEVIEDARYVFPNACETKMVFTINARSLYNFFAHRCCLRAQWEIQELATEMLKLVKEVAPVLFKNAGPSCLNKPCPEGNMSCGKIKEIREKFNNL